MKRWFICTIDLYLLVAFAFEVYAQSHDVFAPYTFFGLIALSLVSPMLYLAKLPFDKSADEEKQKWFFQAMIFLLVSPTLTWFYLAYLGVRFGWYSD